MSEEYLETVDGDNQLTGESKPRSLVHSTGLWHRTVHIYFFRRGVDGIEILVHLRAETKDLNPNRWDTRFGGHIKRGENLEQAVTGEIKDEVGISVDANDLIEGEWRKRNKYPNNEFSKAYYFEFTGDAKELKFNDGEVKSVKWMFVSDIENSMEKEPEMWSGKPAEFNKIIGFLKERLS